MRSIEPAPQAFRAISSTRSKRYQYCIWNAEDRPVFFADLAWHAVRSRQAGSSWDGVSVRRRQVAAALQDDGPDDSPVAGPTVTRMLLGAQLRRLREARRKKRFARKLGLER